MSDFDLEHNLDRLEKSIPIEERIESSLSECIGIIANEVELTECAYNSMERAKKRLSEYNQTPKPPANADMVEELEAILVDMRNAENCILDISDKTHLSGYKKALMVWGDKVRKCVDKYHPVKAPADEGLVEALEKLSRLGNGDKYGNSDGNRMAQEALARYKASDKGVNK